MCVIWSETSKSSVVYHISVLFHIRVTHIRLNVHICIDFANGNHPYIMVPWFQLILAKSCGLRCPLSLNQHIITLLLIIAHKMVSRMPEMISNKWICNVMWMKCNYYEILTSQIIMYFLSYIRRWNSLISSLEMGIHLHSFAR